MQIIIEKFKKKKKIHKDQNIHTERDTRYSPGKFLPFLFLKRFHYFFREVEERNINVREKYQSAASRTRPDQGPNPATQVGALTGNQTSDLSLCRMMPNQSSHTSQGLTFSTSGINCWCSASVFNNSIMKGR